MLPFSTLLHRLANTRLSSHLLVLAIPLHIRGCIHNLPALLLYFRIYFVFMGIPLGLSRRFYRQLPSVGSGDLGRIEFLIIIHCQKARLW
jgi:hypothetical protein